MKKLTQKLLILFIVFLATAQVASAQKSDTSRLSSSSQQRYDLYMQRHKTFNTLGWVLLAPGAGMVVGGLIGASNSNFFSDGFTTASAVAGIGSLMMLGSIPCFVLSGSNAKKAALELKTGFIPGPGGSNYASVGIKFSFR